METGCKINIHLDNDDKQDIDKEIHDVLSKLLFISKIQEDELVNVKILSVMEKGWITSAYRTLIARKESRVATFRFFENTFYRSFTLIETCISSKNQYYINQIDSIVSHIKKAKIGLGNTIKTYIDDRNYTSELETLIGTTDTKLNTLLQSITRRGDRSDQRGDRVENRGDQQSDRGDRRDDRGEIRGDGSITSQAATKKK